jgi:quercetin dioxygenase-like cupin family protein
MEELISQVKRGTELGDYQTGSIVSRILIDKKAGSVTFFAFDKGQRLSEHTAPFDALVYILEGEAEITLRGTPFHLNEGTMMMLPAKVPHAVQAPQRFKMLLIMIGE